MSILEEIKALLATTTKLREAAATAEQITGPNCTWTVLTERLIRNEAKIRQAYRDLSAS